MSSDGKTTGRLASEQEKFWRGEFGDNYNERMIDSQQFPKRVPANIAFFARALQHCEPGSLTEILELGAGTGMNLQALHALLPTADLLAVELNQKASQQIQHADVICGSAVDFVLPTSWTPSLVFTKGLLIHLPIEDRVRVYRRMATISSRYVLMAEYFSQAPQAIDYRGHQNKLWKANFHEEFKAANNTGNTWIDTRLLNYGYISQHDLWPQDDLTWWLIEVNQ